MSSSSFNILGGIPTSKDLAPSIVFVILYALLVPLYLFRMIRKDTRDMVLIRPGIFIALRIAVFIVRAIQSKGNYGEALFIVSQIFLLIGFVFLADPFIEGFKRYVNTNNHNRGSLINRVSAILRLALLGIIGTGIGAGSLIGSVISNPNSSDANKLKSLRLANYVLSLVIGAALILGVFYSHFHFGVDTRSSLFVLGGSCCLIVISLYKLLQSELSISKPWIHTDSCFWVLLVTFEWLATVLILGVNYPALFPKVENPDNHSLWSRLTGGSKEKDAQPEEYAV